jgi:hypothetical protein
VGVRSGPNADLSGGRKLERTILDAVAAAAKYFTFFFSEIVL